jgi:hypothetical protein
MMSKTVISDTKNEFMINFYFKLKRIKNFFEHKMKSDNIKQIFIKFDYNKHNFLQLKRTCLSKTDNIKPNDNINRDYNKRHPLIKMFP